jgi:hypothetical protein
MYCDTTHIITKTAGKVTTQWNTTTKFCVTTGVCVAVSELCKCALELRNTKVDKNLL